MSMAYLDEFVDRHRARDEGYKPFESVKRRPGPETQETDGALNLSWDLFEQLIKKSHELSAEMMRSIHLDSTSDPPKKGTPWAKDSAIAEVLRSVERAPPVQYSAYPLRHGYLTSIGCYCNNPFCKHVRHVTHAQEEKQMKETSETFKVSAISVDYNSDYNGAMTKKVIVEDLRGARSDLSLPISGELATELWETVRNRSGSELEITIKVRRPEKPLEEVIRIEKEQTIRAALERAKELLK
jgi:hypothetical protein